MGSSRSLRAVLGGLVCLLMTVCAGAAPHCPTHLASKIPARAKSLPTGSQFAVKIAGRPARERERVVREQLLLGNIPSFLRSLKPVPMPLPSRGAANTTRDWICVTPDYLAIGSDDDYLRMPMNRRTAMEVAARFGFVLPTPKMVDAIYRGADVRLAPRPMKPGPRMRSIAYYNQHNLAIEAQLPEGAHEALVAGHKKDVVMTNRLLRHPNRVAIYGWHRGPRDPIQPLSTVHGIDYADYSHGVRLVSNVVWVQGVPRSVYDALGDPAVAARFTLEGAIPRAPEIMKGTSTAGAAATM